MKTAWCVIAVVVILCLVWLFAFRSRPIPEGYHLTEYTAESVDPSGNKSNPSGGLQRTRPAKKPQSEDEIARKSEEIFQREMEVHKDIQNQKYLDALEKLVEYYTWTFEHDYESSKGVRGSFALTEWRNLVNVYPPAADKLRELAAQLEDALRTIPISKILFDQKSFREDMTQEEREAYVAWAMLREVCNFNDVLGTKERTLELLTDLSKDEPELALSCWRGAEDTLYDEKAYDLLQVFIPDLNAEYEREMNRQRYVLSRLAQIPMPAGAPPISEERQTERRRTTTRRALQEHIGRLLDFGVATGQTEVVSELAKRTAEEFPDTADLFEKYYQ